MHSVALLLVLSAVTSANAVKRVAVLFRGRHSSTTKSGVEVKLWRAAFEAQRRLLFAPLTKTGATVDVLVASPNSSNWAAMEGDYRSLATGVFSSVVEPESDTLDGKHGEGVLKLAKNLCDKRSILDSGTVPLHFSSSQPSPFCWDAVLVWHFGVAPLEPGVGSWRFVVGGVVAPWREAHSDLPTTEHTKSTRQVWKSCKAFQERFSSDMRGWRSAHVVWWFDGRLLHNVVDALSPTRAAESTNLDGGANGVGAAGELSTAPLPTTDPHYMFNGLKESQLLHFALDGYWVTSPHTPNPVSSLFFLE